jgi:hypothetical protein
MLFLFKQIGRLLNMFRLCLYYMKVCPVVILLRVSETCSNRFLILIGDGSILCNLIFNKHCNNVF